MLCGVDSVKERWKREIGQVK